MKIRKFALDDQVGINKLQQEFMTEFFPEFCNDLRQYQWNADIYDIDEYYIKKNGGFWVAEEDGEIIGAGGFRLLNPDVAEIKRIRIRSSCRGNGIGKAFVHTIEDYCRGIGVTKMLVDTDERLDVAKRMYERLGYTVYKTETVAEDNGTYINYYFQKSLI